MELDKVEWSWVHGLAIPICKCALILVPSINLASYNYIVTIRVIILKLIKLITHSEDHHAKYSLLKKECCRGYNKQGNINNLLLTLLFTTKKSLSFSLKRLVYLDIIPTQKIIRNASGTTRYCKILQGTTRN